MRLKKRLQIAKMRIRRLGWILALIALVSTLGAIVMQKMDLLGVEGQELGAYDGGLGFWTKEGEKSKDIVVMAIDDATIDAMSHDATLVADYAGGQWPYKRVLWQKLFAHLGKQGVRAIVFDAVMTEPNDDADTMQAAVREAGVPVFLGFSHSPSGIKLPKVEAENRFLRDTKGQLVHPKAVFQPPAEPEDPDTFPAETSSAEDQAPIIAKAFAFPVQSSVTFPQSTHFIQPTFSQLWDVTRFGLVSAEADDDGKMRRTRFVSCDPVGNCYPTLAARVMAELNNANNIEISAGRIQIGSGHWRINPDGSAWIHYGGKVLDRFPTYSLKSLIEDEYKSRLPEDKRPPLALPADQLRGKVVFIAGGFSPGTGDVKATPFDAHSPGAMKHAATLENFLRTGFLVDAPYAVNVLVALLLALLSVAVVMVVDSPWVELIWPIAVFFGFYLIPGFVLTHWQVHLLSVMPSLAGSFASVLASVYKNFLSDKQRQEMKEIFGRYMEKHLVDVMVERPTLPTLAGEEVELTLLFSRMPQFAALLERAGVPLADRIRFLNQYHTAMTHILIEHGACIDKYVGDEIRAFFNAPVRHPDHAWRAFQAATQMQQASDELCAAWKEQHGWPLLSTWIAINTDTVWVGNMGSDLLVDYTTIGPGVDRTHWLLDQNGIQHTTLLIGDRTHEQLRNKVKSKCCSPAGQPPFFRLIL